MSTPPSKFAALSKQEGQKLLADTHKRLSLPDSAVNFLRAGEPAVEIVNAANQLAANLIVVGSHGRGGVSRALLGSVAETVSRHAPCPVLVVRAKS